MMSRLKLDDRLGVGLALLIVYIVWGSTYLAIRFAIASMPPFLMAGVRFLIAGSLLYVLLRLRGAPAPSRQQWGGAALVGTLLLAGGNGLVVFAEQWVASSLAALGVATVPLWAALFAGLWGRWPARLEWIGLVLGFIGVGLLNLEGDLRASVPGAIALIAAAISWAFGTVWSRRLPLPGGIMASAAQMLAGGAVLTILSIARGERLTAVPTSSSLLALAYLIIFGALVAFSAYTYLLRHARPALATSYAYVNPVIAVGLGFGLAGERISAAGIAAMVVIVIGVALVVLGREQAPQPRPLVEPQRGEAVPSCEG